MKTHSLAALLEEWFASARRDMPWRTSPTPYFCWLSEIMMQQTTYASVLPYFQRFIDRFPSVESLAAADESDVLKRWEGLGYYARARNLLKAARQIVGAGSPRWPESADEWAALPGIGPYTAAALASVLSGERIAVVDGNVARVFARFWLLDEDFTTQPARVRLAERLRGEIAKAKSPGAFNQAMMELGALVCTPKNPKCALCPLSGKCAARRQSVQGEYPVRPIRRPRPVRTVTSVIVRDALGRVLLTQNREGGLLKGLWELPQVVPAGELTQTFTHFQLQQTNLRAVRSDAEFVDPTKVPLTTATRKALAMAANQAPVTAG